MSPPPPQEPQIVGASESSVRLVGATEHVPVAIDARAHADALASRGGAEPEHVLLHLEDIEAKENPGSVYGVYVNLPEDASDEQLAAHHVGNLSFFGIEQAREPRGDEHPHGIRSSMDITDLAQSLKAQGQWDEQHLHVTLRPLDLLPPEDAEAGEPAPSGHEDLPVHVGRVSISYA